MALTATLSLYELQRVAAAAYIGKTINVILCSVGVSGFTANDLVTDWQSIQVPNSSTFSATVTGDNTLDSNGGDDYSVANGRIELPSIDAAFTAGVTLNWDRVVVYFDGEQYPHSVLSESPNVQLGAGATQTYRINLITDD